MDLYPAEQGVGMKRIIDPARELPVCAEVDVLVVGGGPAGVGAALAAARTGATVLVIEQFNCLGGVATAGGHGHISIYGAKDTQLRAVGGIAYEIARRLVEEGYGIMTAHGVWFEVEGLKFILDKMTIEAGIQVLYHTFFCETLVRDGAAVGAIIQNKSGRQAILARRIVDCTGDGDAAASAGAPCEVGRATDQKCQPTTLMFTIGGVNWPHVEAWRTDYQMKHVWAEAQRNGDMEPFQDQIMGFWWTPTRPDQVGINFTHMIGIDSTNASHLTMATMEGRRQAYHCIDVFRKYVPGMEACYMVSTPNTLGIRESRRIMGEMVLTEQDILAQRVWDDSIGYGAFFVDIHNLDGPGMAQTVVRPEPGFRYQIPYRILVPSGVENILTAGRCVSVTHIALGSIRVMAQCILTGEAAGTAATLSLHARCTPRSLAIHCLQETMRAHGNILTEADFEAVNSGTPWFWQEQSVGV